MRNWQHGVHMTNKNKTKTQHNINALLNLYKNTHIQAVRQIWTPHPQQFFHIKNFLLSVKTC
jgi:hypothetical protein